jgi:iron-sulfur cluster assembly accessory protein
VCPIVNSRFAIAKKINAGNPRLGAQTGAAPSLSLTWIPRSRIFSPMINVTDNAVRQLQSLLSQRPENSRKGLRVEVAKGGCSGLHYEMTLGEREEGDSIVERDGVQFFIDDESISFLRGATLDFTDGLTGTGFRIVNPNASRTCGCGTSFEATQSA